MRLEMVVQPDFTVFQMHYDFGVGTGFRSRKSGPCPDVNLDMIVCENLWMGDTQNVSPFSYCNKGICLVKYLTFSGILKSHLHVIHSFIRPIAF